MLSTGDFLDAFRTGKNVANAEIPNAITNINNNVIKSFYGHSSLG